MLQQRQQIIHDAIVSRMRFAGEQFIADSRSVDSYKDQTGNLRSSIGYRIIVNGVQLYEGFTDKGEVVGLKASKKVMDEVVAELIARYPKSYILVGVAGMEYAAAVESRGLDVITGSSQTAQETLKRGLKDLERKLSKR